MVKMNSRFPTLAATEITASCGGVARFPQHQAGTAYYGGGSGSTAFKNTLVLIAVLM